MISMVDYRGPPGNQGLGLHGVARCSVWWISQKATVIQDGGLQGRPRYSGWWIRGEAPGVYVVDYRGFHMFSMVD